MAGNIKDLKREVVRQFEIFVKNPQTIVSGVREGDYSHLQAFYQKFAEAFIYPDMEGFTENLPKVEMKDARTVPAIIGNAERACGEYNTPDNKVYMYFNRMKKLAESSNVSNLEIVSEFMTSIEILCHEFQHSKQQLYADLLAQGKTDKAKKFSTQLASNSDQIEQDISFNGAECISIIKAVRPDDLYEELRSKTNEPSVQNADPVVEAFYYRRPIEVDARVTSLKTFKNFTTETFIQGKPMLTLLGVNQTRSAVRRHNKDMRRQPVHISKDDILEQLKQLTPADFARAAEGVEKYYSKLSKKQKASVSADSLLNGNAENKEIFMLEEFACAVSELAKALPPEEAIKTLQEIAKECDKSKLIFGKKIATDVLESVKNREKTSEVRAVVAEDFEKEGIDTSKPKKKAKTPKAKKEESLGVSLEAENIEELQ